MGLLDKLLKGLGFEGEEKQTPKEPKKPKEKKQKHKVTASFNLNEVDVEEEKPEPLVEEEVQEPIENKTTETNLDFELVKLNTQVDAQNIIKTVKEGKRVLINIENLSPADATRSLDFISGALFALDKTMKKVDEKLYLIQ